MKNSGFVVMAWAVIVALFSLGFFISCQAEDEGGIKNGETPVKVEPKISISVDPPERQITADGSSVATIKVQVLLSSNDPAEGIPLTLTADVGWFKFGSEDKKIILNAPLKKGRFEVQFYAFPSDLGGLGQAVATIKAVASVEDRVISATTTITIKKQEEVTDAGDDDDGGETECENDNDCKAGERCIDGKCEFGGTCAQVCDFTMSATPDTIKGDGVDTSTITAFVCDGKGDPAQGVSVNFYVSGSAEFLDGNINAVAGTDNKGVASIKVRAIPHTEGQANIQGVYQCDSGLGAGLQEIIKSVDINIEPEDPPPATIDVRVSPALILANGKDTSEIVTLIRAENGDPLETKVTCETTKGKFAGTNRQKEDRWSDSEGMATFTLIADALPGAAQITCTIEVPNKEGNLITVIGTATIRMVSLGQLTWESANPDKLGIQGSGNENSRICFLLVDGDSIPIDSIDISFELTDAPGGPSIFPTSQITDTSGRACTILNTGKVPTTVQVKAKADTGSATLVASSPPIVIAGGKPSAKYFNVFCAPSNVGGLALKLVELPCIVAVADRFSNALGADVPIFFRTEAGTIVAAGYTTSDQIGESTVALAKLTINDPMPQDVEPRPEWGEPFYETGGKKKNPRDGLVVVIAATTGEEEFDDENGNGLYDIGEKFVDLAEPFVDANDNGVWDSGEEFIDVNGNGIWDGPNGAWDGDTIIWAPGYILWTGDLEKNPEGCVQDDADKSQLRKDDQISLFCPNTFDTQDADLNPNELKIGNGGRREIFYQVRDANLNPPNMSTVISFSTDPKLATLINASSISVPDSLGMDIQRVIECPVDPKVCERRYEISNFANGFRGSIVAQDPDPQLENKRDGGILLSAKYKSIPPLITGKGGAPNPIYDNQPQKELAMTLTTKMDDPIAFGPCSMVLTLSNDNAPADGKTQIDVSARARDEKDQPLSSTRSILFSVDTGRFQQSGGATAITKPNAQGSVEVQYIVPNIVPQGNEATISAGFTCDGKPISRTAKVFLFESIPTKASITLSMSKQSVVADGSDFVEVSALVTDENGLRVHDTSVTFTVRTPADAHLFVDPANPLSEDDPNLWLNVVMGVRTDNGVTPTLKLKGGGWKGCNAGIIEIEAETTDPPAKDRQLVKAVKMGSLTFDAAGAPDYLTTFGSGLKETAFITFTLNDTNGNPFSPTTEKYTGQKVSFELHPSSSVSDPSPANPQLLVKEAFTDKLGQVSTLVKSGTTATNFIVKAIAKFDSDFYKTAPPRCSDDDIVGQSKPIPIVGAVPNARYMTFECPNSNIPGLAINFLEADCTLTMADRFSNKIGVVTNVSYRIEAGSINPFSTTPDYTDVIDDPSLLGKTGTSYRTGMPMPLDVGPQDSAFLESREPYYIVGKNINNVTLTKVYNPRDGLVTIIAATTGEEEFFDSNGNGVWDADKEYFVDLPEPFIDSNDNNKFDYNEMFLDANGDGQWNGGNGVWDPSTLIWTSYRVLWTGKVSTPVFPVKRSSEYYGDERFAYTAREMCSGKIDIRHADFNPPEKFAWPEGLSVTHNLQASTVGTFNDRCRITLPDVPLFRPSDRGTLYIGLANPTASPKIVNADKWFKVLDVESPTSAIITVPGVGGLCDASPYNRWDWAIMSFLNDRGNRRSAVCTDGTNTDPFQLTPPTCTKFPFCHLDAVLTGGIEHEVPQLTPYIFFQVPPAGSDTVTFGINDERLNVLNSASTVELTASDDDAALSGDKKLDFTDTLGMDIETVTACGTDNIVVFDEAYTCPLGTPQNPNPIGCDYICRRFIGVGNFAHNMGRDFDKMYGTVTIADAYPIEVTTDPPVPDAFPYKDVTLYIKATVPLSEDETYTLTKIVEGGVD